MKKIFFIYVFLICGSIFSLIFPYPIFSHHTNISENVAYQINNFHETEISPTNQNIVKILPLEFDVINSLLPTGSQFEIFDINNQVFFTAQRTGGKNHIDFETLDESTSNMLLEICENEWNWQRRPVLVKMNDFAFVPASICLFPHGFSSLRNMTGHFCLHFLGSKTDGTGETDAQHQKCVKFALSHGEEMIKKLEL